MSILERKGSGAVRPVPLPMDLDAGALNIKQAVIVLCFVGMCMVVVALGLGLAVLVVWRGGYWLVLGLLGLLVAFVALAMAGVVFWLAVRAWYDHRERLIEWHNTAVDGYVNSGDRGIVAEPNDWSFSAESPVHMVWLAVQLHEQVVGGAETPYSVRNLVGLHLWRGRRVGELTKSEAERVGRKLAALDLIEGRMEGYAGRWVPRSAGEAAERVLKGWR